MSGRHGRRARATRPRSGLRVNAGTSVPVRAYGVMAKGPPTKQKSRSWASH